MEVFEELCPVGPEWTVPWDRIEAAFEWVRRLRGVVQDPRHHAEGDVATHTRMACEALAGLPEWRARPSEERVRLFAAVLLHDSAKPFRTRVDEHGRVTAHGHSRHGDLLARRILWELGAPPVWREHVAALVNHHQVPFWALERLDLERIAFRASLLARNDDLAILATADILGRVCGDADGVLENIALFREYCRELDCLDRPRRFASAHARFQYFRTPGRDPDYAAYDDTRVDVTVLSGLPGVGKDHWIAEHRAGWPVVSLDAVRAQRGIGPGGDQRAVVAAAFDLARAHLRAGERFVWNATNVSRRLRERCVGLAADYRARVTLVGLEAPPDVLRARNRSRAEPVPAAVVERLIAQWEAPDPTEAHHVQWVDTGR
ncbi:AAA family ATPase [Umezawaea sp. Da 62-37]|uniref:AAA family ATPase n=1 Tax=Umezawaea sp. Da 62-37 TaxID=3075927 RepID=UPI0028F70B06|nr:AAA family ATPase [Umezawaea sp. Da 62-37]WNV83596.1 AAA family ATPase [Umezawaea sp. Da 62-37]